MALLAPLLMRFSARRDPSPTVGVQTMYVQEVLLITKVWRRLSLWEIHTSIGIVVLRHESMLWRDNEAHWR